MNNSFKSDTLQIYDQIIRLKFNIYSSVIVEQVLSNEIETPITIGIFGEWGSGKSTLMKNIENDLITNRFNFNKKIMTVYFNAWEFQNESNIWAPLGLMILNEIDKVLVKQPQLKTEMNDKLNVLKRTLFEKSTSIFNEILKSKFTSYEIIQKKINQIIEEEKSIKDVDQYKVDQLMEKYSKFLSENSELKKNLAEIIDKTNICLFVFIDDIDRIADPMKAIEILEGLHLFLSVKNSIFFMAISKEALKIGLQSKFKNIYDFNSNSTSNSIIDDLVHSYIDKMIQVPFNIPNIDSEDIKEYLRDNITLSEGDYEDLSKLILRNPRKIKILINQAILTRSIAEKMK